MKEFKIVKEEDFNKCGAGHHKNIVYRAYSVELEEDNDELLLNIAKRLVEKTISGREIAAVTVYFRKPDQPIEEKPTYKNIDWAPYGRWDKVGTVKGGDYSKHSYYLHPDFMEFLYGYDLYWQWKCAE